jgi:CheY-like chemotaxis protein
MTLFAPARWEATVSAPEVRGAQRVLVVSSHLARKRAIEAMLTQGGLTTEVCTQPVIALARVRAGMPRLHAVFVEYDLGTHTGVEVAEELQLLAPTLPVVLGTTPTLPLEPRAVGERGVTAMVPDVHETTALIESVRRAIAAVDAPS